MAKSAAATQKLLRKRLREKDRELSQEWERLIRRQSHQFQVQSQPQPIAQVHLQPQSFPSLVSEDCDSTPSSLGMPFRFVTPMQMLLPHEILDGLIRWMTTLGPCNSESMIDLKNQEAGVGIRFPLLHLPQVALVLSTLRDSVAPEDLN